MSNQRWLIIRENTVFQSENLIHVILHHEFAKKKKKIVCTNDKIICTSFNFLEKFSLGSY